MRPEKEWSFLGGAGLASGAMVDPLGTLGGVMNGQAPHHVCPLFCPPNALILLQMAKGEDDVGRNCHFLHLVQEKGEKADVTPDHFSPHTWSLQSTKLIKPVPLFGACIPYLCI